MEMEMEIRTEMGGPSWVRVVVVEQGEQGEQEGQGWYRRKRGLEG